MLKRIEGQIHKSGRRPLNFADGLPCCRDTLCWSWVFITAIWAYYGRLFRRLRERLSAAVHKCSLDIPLTLAQYSPRVASAG